MNGGIQRPQFQHLGAGGGDETPIGGAAGGGEFRFLAGDLFYGVYRGIQQGAGGGNEGFA